VGNLCRAYGGMLWEICVELMGVCCGKFVRSLWGYAVGNLCRAYGGRLWEICVELMGVSCGKFV